MHDHNVLLIQNEASPAALTAACCFGWRSLREAELLGGNLPKPLALHPISVTFEPPFTLMTNLIGSGDPQSGVDVSATVSAWGFWQPAISPSRRPSVADALVGSLGGMYGERQVGTVPPLGVCAERLVLLHTPTCSCAARCRLGAFVISRVHFTGVSGLS